MIFDLLLDIQKGKITLNWIKIKEHSKYYITIDNNKIREKRNGYFQEKETGLQKFNEEISEVYQLTISIISFISLQILLFILKGKK